MYLDYTVEERKRKFYLIKLDTSNVCDNVMQIYFDLSENCFEINVYIFFSCNQNF